MAQTPHIAAHFSIALGFGVGFIWLSTWSFRRKALPLPFRSIGKASDHNLLYFIVFRLFFE